MKKTIFAAAGIGLVLAVTTATAQNGKTEEDNLLLNPTLQSRDGKIPDEWVGTDGKFLRYDPTGFKGSPAVGIVGEVTTPVILRQLTIKLVSGEKYNISAWFRTQGYKPEGKGGAGLVNTGWNRDSGIYNLPADSDWTYYERTIEAPPSKDSLFSFAFFSFKMSGELWAADFKLIPLSEKAKKESAPLSRKIQKPAAKALPALVPGKNLLVNGVLLSEQGNFPDNWNTRDINHFQYARSGGPDGKAFLGVVNGDGISTYDVRQGGYKLIPGELYRIGAWVKTDHFKASRAGVIILNDGWSKSAGITEFPENTDWKYFEADITAPTTKEGHAFAFFTVKATGSIQVADLSLYPLSEKAKKESVSPGTADYFNIIPLRPKLFRIPVSDPKLTLIFPYLNDRQKIGRITVTREDGSVLKNFSVPVTETGEFEADLKGIPEGEGRLKAMILDEKTNERLWTSEYPIRLVRLPQTEGRHRRLNALIVSLLETGAKIQSPGEREYTFVNPRDGWVFIGLFQNSARKAENVHAALSGVDGVVIRSPAEPLETMRDLPAGEYRLTIRADFLDARLVVRSIPELFCYALNEKQLMEKHVFNNLNMHSGPARIPEEWFLAGKKNLANMNITWLKKDKNPDHVISRMKALLAEKEPVNNGLVADEFGFYTESSVLYAYSQALWKFALPQEKRIYTYIIAKPFNRLHTDFISAILNASQGRGRMLYEAYCHPQPTEILARKYLKDKLDITSFKNFYPEAVASLEVIFAVFNLPDCLLEHYPFLDNKYYLDMQLNQLANDKAAYGLAGIGWWGAHYTDEEKIRWIFSLFRHYAIEGNTSMLSEKYNYHYEAGHLKNCDFEEGLKNWTAEPAEPESIRAGTFPGYGRQTRWALAGETGDTFCILKRSVKAPNRVTQIAKNLVPGQLYTLRFMAIDYHEMKNKIVHPRRLAVRAEFDPSEAEEVSDKFSLFIHTAAGSRNPPKYGRVNIPKYVFRAKKSAAKITITDWMSAMEPGGPEKQELAVNYIQLTPYFSD